MKKKILISIMALTVMVGPGIGLAEEKEIKAEETITVEQAVEEVTAIPSGERVNFDGQGIELETYLINDENYIRLRDVASLLRDTEAKFDVNYDSELYSVLITTGKAYDQEYQTSNEERQVEKGTKSQQNVLIDSVKTDINGYLINDENYFRLRDLAKVLDFGVAYDYLNNAVLIDSDNGALEDVRPVDAIPSGEKIEYNDEAVSMNTYLIADENYVRLRDVAGLLNGSKSQFAVDFDNDSKSVIISKGKSHDEEFEPAHEDRDEEKAVKSGQAVIIDGQEVELTGYMINDENYFRLRDLGQALDFEVDYDEDTRTVIIKSEEIVEETPVEKLKSLTTEELLKTEDGVVAAEKALKDAKSYVEAIEDKEEKAKAEEEMAKYEELITKAREILDAPTVEELEGQLVLAIDKAKALVARDITKYEEYKAARDAIDAAKKIANDKTLASSTFRYSAEKDIEEIEKDLQEKNSLTSIFDVQLEEAKETADEIKSTSYSNKQSKIDEARLQLDKAIEVSNEITLNETQKNELDNVKNAVNEADLEMSDDKIKAMIEDGIKSNDQVKEAQKALDEAKLIANELADDNETRVKLKGNFENYQIQVNEVELDIALENAKLLVNALEKEEITQEKIDNAKKAVNKAEEININLPETNTNKNVVDLAIKILNDNIKEAEKTLNEKTA